MTHSGIYYGYPIGPFDPLSDSDNKTPIMNDNSRVTVLRRKMQRCLPEHDLGFNVRSSIPQYLHCQLMAPFRCRMQCRHTMSVSRVNKFPAIQELLNCVAVTCDHRTIQRPLPEPARRLAVPRPETGSWEMATILSQMPRRLAGLNARVNIGAATKEKLHHRVLTITHAEVEWRVVVTVASIDDADGFPRCRSAR